MKVIFEHKRIIQDFYSEDDSILGQIVEEANPKCYSIIVDGDIVHTAYTLDAARKFVREYANNIEIQ